MAQSRFYSATAQPTVLTSGITNIQTTINVVATVGFPASVPYILALDYNTPSEEIVLVTAQAGTTLTVTRAYDGTSGTSHNSGAGVRHTWTAKDGNDSRAHEGSSQGVHGLAALSSVVGTLDTQTLSSKTLNSPIINSPTFSGTVSLASPDISGTVTGNATYLMPTFKADIDANPSTIIQKRSATQSGALTSWRDDVGTSLAFVTSAGISRWRQGLTIGSADQFAVDTSGNLTAAGNITTGAWNTFVPTWTATTVNPTIGNGSLTSRWMRVGRMITWAGTLSAGTTTNGGTGVWSMSLPVAAASNGVVVTGSANYFNQGDNDYVGVCQISSGASTASFSVKTSTNSQSFGSVSNTVPVGTSSTTNLRWSITYEAAS